MQVEEDMVELQVVTKHMVVPVVPVDIWEVLKQVKLLVEIVE